MWHLEAAAKEVRARARIASHNGLPRRHPALDWLMTRGIYVTLEGSRHGSSNVARLPATMDYLGIILLLGS